MDIDTVKLGYEIGKDSRYKYTWQSCRKCGIERWVRLTRDKPRSDMCHPCSLRIVHRSHQIRPIQNCLDCNKVIKHSKSGYCRNCRYNHPQFNPGWRGGRIKDKQGHILIKVSPKKVGNNGYIREHLLIWEKVYGALPKGYVIHHLNGFPDDNRIENLAALPVKQHNTILKIYKKRIRQLEGIIKELRSQTPLI